jgi:tripartite-type tricarboxylate transporter receptor subunit TctC
VVENVPGAGGGLAANQLAKTAPKDGTVISVFPEPKIRDQLVGSEGIEFDVRQLVWLGATQAATNACLIRTDSGITSFKEIIGGKEYVVGTTAPGSNIHDMPAVLKAALGANIKLVPGYEGTAKITLGVESKELNGMCNTWESIKSTRGDWLTGSPPFATMLVQQAPAKHPDLPNLPLAEEFAQTADQRQLIRAATSTLAITKPFAAPPGTPPERVAALRQALEQSMKDPELKAEADKLKLDLSYTPPAQVEAIVKEIFTTPPSVVEQLKAALR